MAFTSSTIWEVRDTGSDGNGGGFDPSYGGVDYSQRDTPIFSTAHDVVANGTTTLTSTTGGFTSQMLGNSIHLFTAGLDWGTFQITGYTNGSTIALDRSPGSFTGGWGFVGGARTISQTGFGFPYVAGNKIWVRGGFTPVVNGLGASSGSIDNPVTVEGYSVTRGDGGLFTVTMGGVAAPGYSAGSNSITRNIKVLGASSGRQGIQFTGTYAAVENANISGGVSNCVDFQGSYNTIKRSYLDGSGGTSNVVNVGSVPSPATNCVVEFCHIRGSANGSGIWIANGQLLAEFNTIHDCVNGIVYATGAGGGASGGSRFLFNDIWNNSNDGIQLTATATLEGNLQILGNIVGKNANYNFEYTPSNLSARLGMIDWSKVYIDGNAVFTTGAGNYNNLPGGADELTLTADPFVDSMTSFNFQINTLAGGGALVTANPWKLTWADGVNVGVYPRGAMGSNAAAAAGVVFSTAAPSIDEVQFPTDISRGATGGPSFNTVVIATGSGSEQRVAQWTRPRYRWDVSQGLKTPTQMAALVAFFIARQGKLRGFRFQDWNDYRATGEVLTPTGGPTLQLIKTYTSGGVSLVRTIYKPQAGTVTLTRNGGAYSAFSLDTTTGILTFTPDVTRALTGITQGATPTVTTATAHGLSAGQVVYFSGVGGMTQINGLTGTVQSTPTSTTFTVSINTSSFSAFSSGGSVAKYPQPSDSLTWAGQFDIPVRFDIDEMKINLEDAQIANWDQIPVVELRP